MAKNKLEEYTVKWTTDNVAKIVASSEKEAIRIMNDLETGMYGVIRTRNAVANPTWKKVPEDKVYEIRLEPSFAPIDIVQGDFMHKVFTALKESNILGHGLEINWVNSEGGK